MREKLGRFFRSRKAVTPVLSSLLLTVVAVAAMAIATTATYVITTGLRETISERVVMEDVWFINSTEEICLYVSNVGHVATHVSGVYVNHTSQHFTKPFNLEMGGHNWLNVSFSWVSGGLYYLDVVTSRGTHVGGYFKAP